LALIAGCGGGSTGTDGGSGTCSMDSQCAAMSYCRLVTTRCAVAGAVVIASGSCFARLGPCMVDGDCAPTEVCDQTTYKCRAFPDACTIAPTSCPSGCTWQSPSPCGCVCPSCPAPVDGGATD
jgi:hypothetical protein